MTREQLVKMRKQLATAKKSISLKSFQSLCVHEKSATVINCVNEQIQASGLLHSRSYGIKMVLANFQEDFTLF